MCFLTAGDQGYSCAAGRTSASDAVPKQHLDTACNLQLMYNTFCSTKIVSHLPLLCTTVCSCSNCKKLFCWCGANDSAGSRHASSKQPSISDAVEVCTVSQPTLCIYFRPWLCQPFDVYVHLRTAAASVWDSHRTRVQLFPKVMGRCFTGHCCAWEQHLACPNALPNLICMICEHRRLRIRGNLQSPYCMWAA